MPLRVLSTLAVKTALTRELLPSFVGKTAIAPDVQWNPTTVLMRKIRDGERADLIVLIDEPMARLTEEGIVTADSVRPIATANIGIAVSPDAPAPDISTVGALRTALASARSVALSQGGASGIYLKELLHSLGIADEVNRKATFIPEGFTAQKILTGEADMAIQQISELMTVDGVKIVGPLPEAVQKPTHFALGLFKDAENPDEAKRFAAHLTSRAAHDAYRRGGLVSRLDF